MNSNEQNIALMGEALALAGQARPSPNPRVGAVIVKNGEIVGRGFHKKPGEPHAEIIALREADKNAQHADLYVTLEPCAHVGRTGPCADAVIQAGISRAFIGMADPDPKVNGRGIEKLRKAGIQVTVGVSESACRDLLAGYITHRTLGRPKVTLKAAVTLDGYLAASSNDSKWISSQKSRSIAHALRADSDAVLVGAQTVLVDNPKLTVRDAPGESPLRVVLDSRLKIPPTARLFQEDRDTQVLIAYSQATANAAAQLSNFPHVELLACKSENNGRVLIDDLLSKLAERGVLSVLVEGGQKVIGSFLRAEAADDLVLFIAPKILGGGIPWTDYPNVQNVFDGLHVKPTDIDRIEDDLFYRATISYPSKNR
jgi:diaminohydroxyphosphoribosylaminopyrimidine deaminase / 5-amino-6-(5-phosphoribosylamino)uracil reductase